MAGKQIYGGDPSLGESVYQQCVACHAASYNRVGPLHCGLLGRRAGSIPDFEYSQAMNDVGFVWNEETLDAFLRSPTTYVPGTTMGFYGVKDEKDRRNLIAYLSSLTETSPSCQ